VTRLIKSVEPPAAKGQMISMPLAGYLSCALTSIDPTQVVNKKDKRTTQNHLDILFMETLLFCNFPESVFPSLKVNTILHKLKNLSTVWHQAPFIFGPSMVKYFLVR
jgi:hypothetical protein